MQFVTCTEEGGIPSWGTQTVDLSGRLFAGQLSGNSPQQPQPTTAVSSMKAVPGCDNPAVAAANAFHGDLEQSAVGYAWNCVNWQDDDFCYRHYYGKQSVAWYRPGQAAWRKAVFAALDEEGASCGFYAIAAIVSTEQEAEDVMEWGRNGQAGLRRGLTARDIQDMSIALDVPLSIALVGQRWVQREPEECVMRYWRHVAVNAARGHYGVMLVPYDDFGTVAYHWLPFTSIDVQCTLPLKRQAYYLLNPRQEEEPEGFDDEVLEGMAELLARWEQAALPPAYALTREQIRQRIHPDDRIGGEDVDPLLKGPFLICGEVPPNLRDRDPALLGASRFHKIGQGRLDCGDMVEVQGPPSFFDRARAKILDCTFLWQLRPSVVPHMAIDDGHYVYVYGGAPLLQDPTLLETGDYNPVTLGRLQTEGGVFSFVEPKVHPGLSGRPVTVLRLRRVALTSYGAVLSFVPLALEAEVSVRVTHYLFPTTSMPLAAFDGDRAAWLRASFTALIQASPDHIKGLLAEQRNLMCARLEKGQLGDEFDPVELARELCRYSSQTRRLWSGEQGYALV